ncbi:hypothetical protein [Bradyrhizobium sp. dw_411]|nr:hypothetical protein [Bradyrhizobium sp. dw_411]
MTISEPPTAIMIAVNASMVTQPLATGTALRRKSPVMAHIGR